MNINKIFLGGTCAHSTWRDELMPLLDANNIKYFNPVVKNWTEECQAIEENEKNFKCDTHLYVITKEMMGTYSIAEVINSAWQSILYGTTVNNVIFCILDEGTWQKHDMKSFKAVMSMIENISPYNSLTCVCRNMNDLMDKILINQQIIKHK